MGSMELARLFQDKWDYSKSVKTLISNVKKEFPHATKLKPQGWKKLAKNYNDYDGMDELDETNTLFKGTNSAGATCGGFDHRTSLPQVMYDDKCQGRKPLETLIGAVLGHAYFISQKNNSIKNIKEWVEIKKDFDKPEYYQKIIKKINLPLNEPLNQALYFMIDKKKDKAEDLLFSEALKQKNKP
jgi:hypothetical protein